MPSLAIEILKIFFIFAFSLGLWTCINLIVTRRNDPYIRNALIIYIALLLCAPINAYLNLIHAEPSALLSAIGQTLSWIYGPLLVLLVNRLLFKKIDPLYFALNLIPFAFFALDKICRLDYVPFGLYILLLYAQIVCYLSYALTQAFGYRSQLLKLNSHYRHGSYYWALHLSFGLIIVMIADLIIVSGLYFGTISSMTFTLILACAFSIYVSALALLFIYQPQLSSPVEPHIAKQPQPAEEPSLRSAQLSADFARRLQANLGQLVTTYKPHQDNNMSLSKLASLLAVTPHQLSELLNVHMQVSFYDYLNTLRHEESLKLLCNTQQNYSITDIAYRAGYNNRNSFYKIFKEKTGVTPSEFKKNVCSNTYT
jgi:AraC-like DNA-binding protein